MVSEMLHKYNRYDNLANFCSKYKLENCIFAKKRIEAGVTAVQLQSNPSNIGINEKRTTIAMDFTTAIITVSNAVEMESEVYVILTEFINLKTIIVKLKMPE